MKIPSINFNENGRIIPFTFAINFMNIAFFMALAIPYPWYGKYRSVNSFFELETKWHIRWKILNFVIYKKKK